MSNNPDLQSERSRLRRTAQRALRHVRWAREGGVGRLVEEDELSPFTQIPIAFKKWRWRRAHDIAPHAVPVYVVGVQRSGTNMLVRGLETSPEFEVHNENDRRAFERFMLRPNEDIRRLIVASDHRYILFKPLCDSHRTVELLEEIDTPANGRAIWAYRSVDGRVRSALAKFGSNNLEVLREIAEGRGRDRWQARGISAETLDLIKSFDYSVMSPASAAALFWYVRNLLYFDLGLDKRADVMLSSYDMFIQEPEVSMRALCDFLGFDFTTSLVEHVEQRTPKAGGRVDLDPAIRARCDELTERLDREATRRLGQASVTSD